jgi:dipeptidyl aminopeptidase/acylaminoacyl peptidase
LRASALLAVVFTPAWLASQEPPRVNSLRFSTPAPIATLDMAELKGEPSRLAWSPDGTRLYVQTLEGGFGRTDATLHHYVLDAVTGRREAVDMEPEWAAQYWTAKSGQTSPDQPPLTIDLKTERVSERATSLPRGGDLARGGTTPNISENDEVTIAGAQTVSVITLTFDGEVVGQFTNSVLVPGLTYGWGPMGAKIIAFAVPKSGRVAVMDDRGQKQEIPGSKDAILPAWSPDGDRVAWLQKDGRRKYLLQVSRVSVS